MKTKLFLTNTSVYSVTQNEDGSLLIQTKTDGESIPNAGQFILNCGGIESIMSKCIDSDISIEQYRLEKAELVKLNKELKSAENGVKEIEKNKSITDDYNALLTSNAIIPVNIDNLRIVMRYLNMQNWGSWELPKMNIGYSANQFDCDGKSSVTIKLDTPISDDEYEVVNEKMFSYGNPNGHLTKYTRIR